MPTPSLQTNPVDTAYANMYATTGMQLCSSQDGITALGSTQATAQPIVAQQVNVTTVAASTGVILPPSQSGMEIIVADNGANPLTIYPAGTDKINALAAGAGFLTGAAPNVTILYCFTAGQWFTK